MSELSDIIRHEISALGPISFARYMELALYQPHLGYYEHPAKQIGCQGDFYTSVSVGPVFGALLAAEFARWLDEIDRREFRPDQASDQVPIAGHSPAFTRTRRFQLIEAGSHDGRLALDILQWVETHRPELARRIDFQIVEPSNARQAMQRKTLSRFVERVHWVPSLKEIAPKSVTGVIFANELLDAMPVHRIGWDAGRKRWFEWRVTHHGGRFQWSRSELGRNKDSSFNSVLLPTVTNDLASALPDGFTTEVCPAAIDWWAGAAQKLRLGNLMTLDYGLTESEFFTPSRPDGTLRAFHRHRASDGVLDEPGARDITAHVNFTAAENAGMANGLVTTFFDTQARFLTGIFKTAIDEPQGFPPWTPDRLRQFKTLTHPEHLGHSFKVLVQSTQPVP